MVGQPHFGDNKWRIGEIIDPSDTDRAITMSEDVLGNCYNAKSKSGKPLVVQWVKNDSGGTLTKGQSLKFKTGAGRWRKDVTVTTDASDPVAGFVPEEYNGGVPNGMYFCIIKYGPCKAILQTTTGSDTTLTVGNPLVASDDNGQVHAQPGTASNSARAVGYATVATTSGVENGDLIDIFADVLIP